MSDESVLAPVGVRLERSFRKPPWVRAAAVGVAVAALVAAFLMFGPVGLGNGPLHVTASTNFFSWNEPVVEPAVYVVPLGNTSGTAAKIDRVNVMSAAGHAPLRVLSVRAGRYVGSDCFVWGPASSLSGCVQPSLVPAAGFSVPARADASPRPRQGPALVIELAGPPPAQCTVITAIVLRYHVGIRHYAATVPQGSEAVCGKLARPPAN